MMKAIHSFKEVFSHALYIKIALVVSILVLLITIWLPNFQFLKFTVSTNAFDVVEKAKIIMYSLGAFVTNFTLVSRTFAVIIAVLMGINIAFLVYYFKKRIGTQKAAGTSVAGITSGLLGVGCSACGSVVLSSIFGVSAATGFIGILPLKGLEFSILSVAILGASTYYIAVKIQSPLVCKPQSQITASE